MRSVFACFLSLLLLYSHACTNSPTDRKALIDAAADLAPVAKAPVRTDSIKTIHVFVALCDNKYQGIVPVPASIGNGQNPATNLYWGAGYGIKTYFTKSAEWKLVTMTKNPGSHILERLLFKHKQKNLYLLADAYDGRYIREATIDYLNAAAGQQPVTIQRDSATLHFGGASQLLAYIGHNGLMDFSLPGNFSGDSAKKRETIILACYSKNYFQSYIKKSGARPLLWTKGLMAPEAYTLHDAIHEWINNKSPQAIKIAAAHAYAKYQKCSRKAAENLIVQGW